MTKLTPEDVAKIANLIRIKINDAEIESYRSQLETVLDYLEMFGELDTKDVEITSQVTGLKNVLQDDEPRESLPQSEALKNANKSENGYFVVSKVL